MLGLTRHRAKVGLHAPWARLRHAPGCHASNAVAATVKVRRLARSRHAPGHGRGTPRSKDWVMSLVDGPFHSLSSGEVNSAEIVAARVASMDGGISALVQQPPEADSCNVSSPVGCSPFMWGRTPVRNIWRSPHPTVNSRKDSDEGEPGSGSPPPSCLPPRWWAWCSARSVVAQAPEVSAYTPSTTWKPALHAH